MATQNRTVVKADELIKRINEVLAKEGKEIRRPRATGRNTWAAYGDFYIANIGVSTRAVESHVDLDALGRKLGVLKEDEILVED